MATYSALSVKFFFFQLMHKIQVSLTMWHLALLFWKNATQHFGLQNTYHITIFVVRYQRQCLISPKGI